jgi:hypothetical protein
MNALTPASPNYLHEDDATLGDVDPHEEVRDGMLVHKSVRSDAPGRQ